ncbi:peptide-methionine (R)-S-oxide reductase MsrB [Formosa sp. S-31]|uniref:peptide-methionine (R)-S-oxide reductase MsrB n=1 Tax=Formosa sp. S-31 TaxID=2790949 RepID=UPI003EBA8C31
MKLPVLLIMCFCLFSCHSKAQQPKKSTTYEVSKTEAEWKQILSPEQYYILREAGTEAPYSSDLNKQYALGTYYCAACKAPLFKSNNKYDSGCGWPSFDQEIPGAIAYSKDSDPIYGTEEHCAKCGSHLGHIFNDGPKNTTGKRHCINGDALIFEPAN